MLEHYSWFICAAVVSPSLIMSSSHLWDNTVLLRIRMGEKPPWLSCNRCTDYKAGEEDGDELIDFLEHARYQSTVISQL